jgi:hypothetical protein
VYPKNGQWIKSVMDKLDDADMESEDASFEPNASEAKV